MDHDRPPPNPSNPDGGLVSAQDVSEEDIVAEHDRRHLEFLRGLDPQERQLIIIRDELYDGSWEEMKNDLEDRRDGKPFIFKLANRIDEDLRRIERLRSFERSEDVNLGELLEEDE